MSILEKVSHLSLIAFALTSMGILLEKQLVPRGGSFSADAAIKGLAGKPLDVPGVKWSAAPVNVAFFISTQCHFCAASMPFYKKVSESRDRARVALSVLSPDPTGDMEKWLSDQSVAVDGVYAAPHNPGLRGTPTLLIVDAGGIVRRVFIGELDSAREQEFLQIVKTGSITGARARLETTTNFIEQIARAAISKVANLRPEGWLLSALKSGGGDFAKDLKR
jgi:hypothetical protein